LKTSLEGEVLSLVSHLAITSGNYLSAWDILRSRYRIKRDLARTLLEALFQPHVIKWDDATSIKKSINTILEHTSALDNLEFVTRQWSPKLVHIFENHLDFELHARWEHIVDDKHNTQVSELVDFLRSNVRSAEDLPQSSASSYLNKAIPKNNMDHIKRSCPLRQVNRTHELSIMQKIAFNSKVSIVQ